MKRIYVIAVVRLANKELHRHWHIDNTNFYLLQQCLHKSAHTHTYTPTLTHSHTHDGDFISHALVGEQTSKGGGGVNTYRIL
jgi:hypothetical protein